MILDPQLELASLDVVFLFTNVPSELVLDFSLQKRWHLISTNTSIPIEEFLCVTRLILDCTFFSFNHINYKQIFGTPMGSSLSPIISDLVLQDLETEALKLLRFEIPIHYRYVDDILLAAHCTQFEDILKMFNSIHSRLKFTLEYSNNNEINFLDTKIIIDDRVITFHLYKKPTSSERYLNFHSHHPISHKRGIIYGMVDETILLSHPHFHQKNLIKSVKVLLNNVYPLHFIFNTIRSGILLHSKKEFLTVFNNTNDNIVDPTSEREFFTIPYLNSISESFIPVIKKYGYDIAFSIPQHFYKMWQR